MTEEVLDVEKTQEVETGKSGNHRNGFRRSSRLSGNQNACYREYIFR